MPGSQNKAAIAASLLAVYVIWGSTYYAMRVALRFLPPFLMAGPRFLIAGGILFAVLRVRGAPLPSRSQWLSGGLIGILLLGFGNGLVAIAQRTVDSGVAATVVATMPLWAALIAGAWGDRPTARELAGLFLGFAGTTVLQRGGSLSFASFDSLVLCVAPIAWAFGSVLSRRLPMPVGPMSAAVQMLIGGIVMIGVAVVRGEVPRGPPTSSAVLALLYLIFFGSLVGFSAYGYLLRTTRPAVATSYAYVNPMVALGIGALFAGERFTMTKLIACLLTIVGVVVVTAKPSSIAPPPASRRG